MSLKIPLNAALDCIKAAVGHEVPVRKWYNHLQPNEYNEQNKAVLKMRKVCHAFAYGELRFGLLDMVVITLLRYISCYDVLRPSLSLVEVPEFWVKNSGSVKAVRMNDSRCEAPCEVRDGDVRIGAADGSFLGFLSNVRDISFNYCDMNSKTLEPISFSTKTHRVTFRWCREVDDLSSLKNVHTVRLLSSGKNSQPLDASVLEHCHTLITANTPVINVEKSNIRKFETVEDREFTSDGHWGLRPLSPWKVMRYGDLLPMYMTLTIKPPPKRSRKGKQRKRK